MPDKTMRAILSIALLFLALAWSGCEATKTPQPELPADRTFQVTGTIPFLNQFDVVLSSKIIATFSADVDADSIADKIALTKLDNGAPTGDIAVTATVVGPSIVLKPSWLLDPLSQYQLTILAGISSSGGSPRTSTADRVVTFETGVRRPDSAHGLSVIHVLPGADDITWDVQTFRVYFNEPISRPSLAYGASVRFEDADTGDLLPGNLFGRGNQIVFDPSDDLTPGTTYHLVVTTALKDANGQSLAEDFVAEFVPQSSGPRTNVYMDNCPSAVPDRGFCSAIPAGDLPANRFTGLGNNTMLADSLLLGASNIPVGGSLLSEFGDTTAHPNRTPFVLRKGQQIVGASLVSMLGGEIPSGVESGPIYTTLLTDAVGEMLGSEYVHGVPGLPPVVKLTMDAAMVTEDPTSDAVMGQPLLGATVVGQASVGPEPGDPTYEAMQIEIAGFTEIELVGETIPVTLSLLQIPPPTVPEPTSDTVPPTIMSVSPANGADRAAADDEAIVVFSEPFNPNTVPGRFHVTGPAGEVTGSIDLYPPKIAFRPDSPWDPLSTYTIQVDGAIEDLSGNALGTTQSFVFTTSSTQTSASAAPLIASTYPGQYDGATMPKNFLPSCYFTQLIDPGSMVYGETYGLYEGGGRLVPGTPLLSPRWVQFVPDAELKGGMEYQWIFTEAILNSDGVALDTDYDGTAGGTDFVVVFTGSDDSEAVQSMLYTYPIADTDSNGFLDGRETGTSTNFFAMSFPPFTIPPAYAIGYQPIVISRLTHDPDGSPRVPISVEETMRIFGTNTTLSLGSGDADAGLLDSGRLTIKSIAMGAADLVPAADGLTAVDTRLANHLTAASSLMNAVLEQDVALDILGKLRFGSDGRMVVTIQGSTTLTLAGIITLPTTVDLTTVTVPPARAF